MTSLSQKMSQLPIELPFGQAIRVYLGRLLSLVQIAFVLIWSGGVILLFRGGLSETNHSLLLSGVLLGVIPIGIALFYGMQAVLKLEGLDRQLWPLRAPLFYEGEAFIGSGALIGAVIGGIRIPSRPRFRLLSKADKSDAARIEAEQIEVEIWRLRSSFAYILFAFVVRAVEVPILVIAYLISLPFLLIRSVSTKKNLIDVFSEFFHLLTKLPLIGKVFEKLPDEDLHYVASRMMRFTKYFRKQQAQEASEVQP